jgi:hypothetical protein
VAWNIEQTDEFTEWWDGLTEGEQIVVDAFIRMLEEKGPALTRPYADTLKGSKVKNLKELRPQYGGKPYRVLFAFDPRQTGILLLGGKKGTKNWYAEKIAEAEKIYAEYLEELKKEGLI